MTLILDNSVVENTITRGGAGLYTWDALTKSQCDCIATSVHYEQKNNWEPSWGGWLELPQDEQAALVSFCSAAFASDFIRPMKRVNESSYGLKHLFEGTERGFYVTNGQFKMAMLFAGFAPDDPRDHNWSYKRLWFSKDWDTKSYPWKWNGA